MATHGSKASPIRVVIVQPALPRYRVPVFAELACRDGISLDVVYGTTERLPNAAPAGFRSEHSRLWVGRCLGHPVYWHHAQWQYAAPGTCDVLVLTWDTHYTSLIPTLQRARLHGIRTVLWGHGVSKSESWLRRTIRERVGRLSDALLFYSHSAADQFRKREPNAERIFVAANAIDQNPIQAARQDWLRDPDRLARFRAEQHLNHGPVILFASRLEAANRLDELVNALPKLTREFPRLTVVIIGNGDQEERRLRELAAQMKVREHLRFLGAIYEEETLAPWFMSSDLYCYPSNIGLSVLHALGYGLPVITGSQLEKHNPEIEHLKHNVNGLLYPSGNPDALAHTLACALRDQTLRGRLSENALRVATEDATLTAMVDGLEGAIRYSLKI